MKSVLICPADRSAVLQLALRQPLATVPILGRSVVEHWIEALAHRGVKQITLLAADRPNIVRDLTGDGRRWGVQVEVVPTAHELTVDEAARKIARRHPAEAVALENIVVIDHLPGQPDLPLFDSYAGFVDAARAWIAQACTPGRVGVREYQPGVWIGLRTEVHGSARLTAPCWIGDFVRVGENATIGPGAIVDDRCVVEAGSRVVEAVVLPDTLVGKFVSVTGSIAHGSQLIHCELNSTVEVPDPFLLADLTTRSRDPYRTTLLGRVAALFAMVVTAPFAVGMILLSLVRSYPPWHLRLGLRSQFPGKPVSHETFAYYELTGAKNWLRRWPQFWNIVGGNMAWFGNRPLRPTQALVLANDFERLWLAAPVGLISLADAYGCPDGISDEAMAHASFYAVHRSVRLNAFILSRTILRAALVWPIRGHRRKDTAVPLQTLVPKQEL